MKIAYPRFEEQRTKCFMFQGSPGLNGVAGDDGSAGAKVIPI